MILINKEQIYIDYKDKVYGYFYGKLQNQQIAEDLCADVFVKVYSKLDSFDPSKASISTWIYTISQNLCTDYFRRNRGTAEINEEYAQEGDFVEDLCHEETLDRLADGLEILPELERDIILLHYYKGMKLKDIADKMEISYSYIKSKHGDALNKLKIILEN